MSVPTLVILVRGVVEVGLADEPAVVPQVELVAGVEGRAAHDAGKALHMVDVVVGSPNHIARGNHFATASTARPEQPAKGRTAG